jgi:hypothetical protein
MRFNIAMGRVATLNNGPHYTRDQFTADRGALVNLIPMRGII